MLDGIALLLVFKPGGDCIATGMHQEGSTYTIYWAKNNNVPATVPQLTYLSQLKQAFKTSNDPMDALNAAIPMCERKMLSRVKRLDTAIQELALGSKNVFGIKVSDLENEALRIHLMEAYGMKNEPLEDGLDRFARAVKQLNKNSSAKDFQEVICFAYFLTGPRHKLTKIARHIVHRIRKVGDYYGVCVRITAMLKRQHPSTRSNFTIQQLFPPPFQILKVPGNTVEALNVFADHYKTIIKRIEDFDELKAVFETAQPGSQGGTIDSRITQHCELTVGLYIWKLKADRQAPGNIEVGCSKACCFYCEKFMEKFNEWAKRQQQVRRIMTSARHGKYVAGWAMPNCDEEVSKSVLEYIGGILNEVIDEVTGPRRNSGGSYGISSEDELETAMLSDSPTF